MPLDFKEPLEPNKAQTKQKFVADVQAGAKALVLDTQVVPELIRKVGEWKSGRISQANVEAYLDRHTLIFDRELLAKMFTEADYGKEGSLHARALIAAISGRYPKRELTSDWRKLTALLLGLKELVLTTDDNSPTKLQNTSQTNGRSFNSDSLWNDPPPPLPPVPPMVWRRRRAKSAEAKGQWAAMSSTLASTSGQHASSPNATLHTTGGLKQPGQIAPEMHINQGMQVGTSGATHMLSSSAVDTGQHRSRSTFATQREFNDFSRGLELTSSLSIDNHAGLMSSQAGQLAATGRSQGGGGVSASTAIFVGSPKPTVRAMGAPLPPTAIIFPSTSLQTLRASVRSISTHKPEFVTMHRPLGSSELDMKKTLGQVLDVGASMARVEPVRDTKVLYNADFMLWQDYAAHCRTAPNEWYNDHPAALAARANSTVKTGYEGRYPWC